jgi:hypothetical protein
MSWGPCNSAQPLAEKREDALKIGADDFIATRDGRIFKENVGRFDFILDRLPSITTITPTTTTITPIFGRCAATGSWWTGTWCPIHPRRQQRRSSIAPCAICLALTPQRRTRIESTRNARPFAILPAVRRSARSLLHDRRRRYLLPNYWSIWRPARYSASAPMSSGEVAFMRSDMPGLFPRVRLRKSIIVFCKYSRCCPASLAVVPSP